MIKGFVLLIVISLMTLSAGLSYRSQFDYNVIVIAEEEERSSENSLDENQINLCSVRLNNCDDSCFFRNFSVHEKFAKPYRMYWSSANINIHDIPPERFF